MGTVTKSKSTITLPLGLILTLTGAGASGVIWRLSDSVGGEPQGRTTFSGSEIVIGPFTYQTRFEIISEIGTITYAIDVPDPATQDELDALSEVYQAKLTNDVLDLIGEGVPVDYTDGDPAATGEGVAGPGSRYTDITNSVLYLNTGTKAQPIWTALAFVA